MTYPGVVQLHSEIEVDPAGDVAPVGQDVQPVPESQ